MSNKLTIEQYEKAITSLTPGGSEFVKDPEYCAKHVKEFQASQHQIICNLVREKKKLKEENALLTEALEGVINSWNKRMGGDTEELKTTNINGDIIKFWSPIASLIDSEPIHKAKELLNNLKKLNLSTHTKA